MTKARKNWLYLSYFVTLEKSRGSSEQDPTLRRVAQLELQLAAASNAGNNDNDNGDDKDKVRKSSSSLEQGLQKSSLKLYSGFWLSLKGFIVVKGNVSKK